MSGKKYPVVGQMSKSKGWIAHPKTAPKCDVEGCNAPAQYRVEFQVNWFRGDDVLARACSNHQKDTAALLAGAEMREAALEAARAAKAKEVQS